MKIVTWSIVDVVSIGEETPDDILLFVGSIKFIVKYVCVFGWIFQCDS